MAARFRYVALLGDDEEKLMAMQKATRDRVENGIWLNFQHSPSVGVMMLTTDTDAKKLLAEVEATEGVEAISGTSEAKLTRGLRAFLGFQF